MLSLRKLLALAVCATVLPMTSTEASDATPARRLRGEAAAADATDSTSFNFGELRAGSNEAAMQPDGGRPPQGSFDGSRPQGSPRHGSMDGHPRMGSFDGSRPDGPPPFGSFDGSFGGRPRMGNFDGSRPQGPPPHGSFDGSFGGRPPHGSRGPSGSKHTGSSGDVRELDPEARRGSFDGSRPQGPPPPHGSFDGSRPQGAPPHGSFDGSRPQGFPIRGRGSHAGKHSSDGSNR